MKVTLLNIKIKSKIKKNQKQKKNYIWKWVTKALKMHLILKQKTKNIICVYDVYIFTIIK